MKSGTSILGYQLRLGNGGDPETLIAPDITDAMRQARQRAEFNGTPVALWRDGVLIAECAPSTNTPVADEPSELMVRLIEAGVYVFPVPPQKRPE